MIILKIAIFRTIDSKEIRVHVLDTQTIEIQENVLETEVDGPDNSISEEGQVDHLLVGLMIDGEETDSMSHQLAGDHLL